MKLQDYLKENVKKAPDGLFLISGEKSYTYHQFNEEVNGYAAGLNELVYGKEMKIDGEKYKRLVQRKDGII